MPTKDQLRSIEWAGKVAGAKACPACGWGWCDPGKHAPDCWLAAALARLSREVAIEREAGVDARNSLRLADAAVDDLKARLATAERERDEAREALANVKNMGAWRKWDE